MKMCGRFFFFVVFLQNDECCERNKCSAFRYDAGPKEQKLLTCLINCICASFTVCLYSYFVCLFSANVLATKSRVTRSPVRRGLVSEQQIK